VSGAHIESLNNSGVYRLPSDQNAITEDDLEDVREAACTVDIPQNHVFRMADDGKTVWGSSIMGGLVRFDEAAGRFTAAPVEHGLGSKYLYAMDGHPGVLWLGSGAGVNCYDTAKRHWVEAVTADGWTGYAVRAVVVAGNDCWFGTSYGLFHRDLATGVQRRWTAAEGLPDDEVSALLDLDGTTLVVATKTAVSACRLSLK